MTSPANPAWSAQMWDHCRRCFADQQAVLWPNLSRATSLLAVLNISLFFLSGAVQCQGYYWPIYSLGLLGVVEIVLLLPLGLNRQLWFYLLVLSLWLIAGWFLVGSILFWLRTAPPGT